MSAPPLPAAGLRAVTRWIEPPANLLEHLGSDGFAWLRRGVGFVTAGTIASVDVDDAPDVLAAIEHDGPGDTMPGIRPLAFGALPFDPDAPSRCTIPATVVGCSADGRAWVTKIDSPLEHEPSVQEHLAGQLAYGQGDGPVTGIADREAWRRAVLDALDAIERGPLRKVVLARALVIESDEAFDRTTVLARLAAQQPECFVYGTDGFVGASPELLVRRFGTIVDSQPVAGTAIGDDAALARSTKDAAEHQYVVDAIDAVLAPLCEHLELPTTPQLASFGGVTHLVTPIRGRLCVPAPAASTLARRLHPTPAVGGTPTAEALSTIARLEPTGRGRYAGPVGWVDTRGDGEWVIALRGAELDGRHALLRTGAGIVAGSDPDREWAETEIKLEPMLRALHAIEVLR